MYIHLYRPLSLSLYRYTYTYKWTRHKGGSQRPAGSGRRLVLSERDNSRQSASGRQAGSGRRATGWVAGGGRQRCPLGAVGRTATGGGALH